MNTEKDPSSTPISEAITDYLLSVEMTRAWRTFCTYRTGMNQFRSFLALSDFDPENDPLSSLSEQTAADFAQSLLDKRFSPATVSLYLTSIRGFFEYITLELDINLNIDRIRRLIKSKTPRARRRLPQFSWDDIETVIQYCMELKNFTADNLREHLRELRDRAFIITLADTGLRVHKACNLARGDIDWNRNIALVSGKGGKDAIVRFSMRAMEAITRYLSARMSFDGATGRPLSSLPVFARHDRGAGKKVLSITTYTGAKIVSKQASQALADQENAARITPHSFRHYFVTKVVKATNNIKVAQDLARHENISTTEIYTHLVDQDLDEFYKQAIEDE
ncbi:MAG: tyrosine-type recombinase/integrase [Anaerolineaceae bacterium]|nr:tyrosine-type recombinase/integrase [Anaerolineaceae bacterium]